MTLEEMIRQIVRDEIAKTQRPPTAPERWRDMFTQPEKCPLGCPPLSACGNVACPMRAPTVMYTPNTGYGTPVDNVVGIGVGRQSVVVPAQRTGCACAPGVERVCDEATCPWKNKP
jgi:hypothetical protein